MEELTVNHIFFTFSKTTGHNSSSLHFAETWRPTDFLDFLELVRGRTVRTSSVEEGRVGSLLLGSTHDTFSQEREAKYNHDIYADFSPCFSLPSRRTRRLTHAVYEHIATVMALSCQWECAVCV